MDEMTPAQPGPEEGASPEAALGQAAQLVANTGEGLAMLLELTSAARPEVAPRMEKLLAEYQSIVEEAALDQPAGPAPKGAQVPPEVGGAQGAMPVGPQGMPRG